MYFLAHYVDFSYKKTDSKQGCLQLQKKQKKSKWKKRSVFILWINPKLEFITEHFSYIEPLIFSNVRLFPLQILFLFWKFSQSILLQVLHPLEVSSCPSFSRRFSEQINLRLKLYKIHFYLSTKKNWKTPQKAKYALDKEICYSLKIYILTNCVMTYMLCFIVL